MNSLNGSYKQEVLAEQRRAIVSERQTYFRILVVRNKLDYIALADNTGKSSF